MNIFKRLIIAGLENDDTKLEKFDEIDFMKMCEIGSLQMIAKIKSILENENLTEFEIVDTI